MKNPIENHEELFVLRKGDDSFYLYAPLRRFVAQANGAAIEAVMQHLKAPQSAIDSKAEPVIDQLRSQGLFSEPYPRPPVFPESYSFCPHEVTLFPTSRCNLRCRYCYADAGCKSVDMPWEVARAAIDLVAANAGLLGSPKFSVGFHGGGEPTLAWDLVVASVEYAREKADALGLDVEIFAATNALLTPKKRKFIAETFNTVNVSLDGPPDIQNLNRPTVNGKGSYEQVAASLHDFEERGLSFGIRSTITAATVGRMSEIVAWLTDEFATDYIHLEPVWQCGRCTTTGEQPPSHDAFAKEFARAKRTGDERGVNVFYSGARIDVLTSKFCAAPGDGFSVLPEGIATSCYEITESSDPRAAIFHYGKYVPDDDRFEFDEQKLAKLRGYSVENHSYCSDCFCRWHCAGDCLAKVFERSGTDEHQGSERCSLNRELTLISLDDLIQSTTEKRAGTSSPAGVGLPCNPKSSR